MPKILTRIAQWSAALLGGIALSACSKVVSFVEEVEIEGKTYRVERKEYFKRMPIEMNWTFVFLESEIYVKDLGLPRWRSDLSPMYLGLNKDREYVLVGLITNAAARAKRTSLSSSYVGFKVVKDQWIEIPVPLEFDGRKATFLMATNAEKGEKALLTAKERDFRNSVQGVGRVGAIDSTLVNPTKGN